MYSLAGYGAMIADRIRMQAHIDALRSLVKPQTVVVDLGTGTGIFALIACRLGARRVYAIESSSWIQLARELAKENRILDRIEFIQESSAAASLPERADVMISDLRGVLPLFGRHLPSVIDARKRFLKPGGHLIPERDHLLMAAVETLEDHQHVVEPWCSKPLDLSLEAARKMAVHEPSRGRFDAARLLSEPRRWITLDYATLEGPNVCSKPRSKIMRTGTAHGLAIWFESELTKDITMTTAPDEPKLIYGGVFFPLAEPIDVRSGDELSVAIEARLVGESYVWRWNSEIQRDSVVLASFQQSSFQAEPMSLEGLQKRSAAYKPRLNEMGEVDRFILTSMNGETDLKSIAADLSKRFPSQFDHWQRALDYVSQLSLRYSV